MKADRLFFFFVLSLLLTGYAQDKPKNIILCISDGCGYNQVTAASYFKFGVQDGFSFQKFPVVLAVSTYSADSERYNPQKAWKRFDYVLHRPIDSAAAATALAAGVKTKNGLICVDENGDALQSITEIAELRGKSTGIITSVQFSHATPAAFGAHNISRDNYEEIAREMIEDSSLEVLMGCGHPLYDDNGELTDMNSYEYIGGQETWEQLRNSGTESNTAGKSSSDNWHLVEDLNDFVNLMTGPTPQRVIGIPKVHQTLQQSRLGDNFATPYTVPYIQSVPSLATMTRGALNVLDNNPRGFFLLIEGGAIDWAGHDNQSGRMIEEEIDFAEAVDAVIEWVVINSSWDETLVMVTGDHETGYLTGPGSGNESVNAMEEPQKIWKPVINNGKGKLPGMEWHTHGHSNSLIPLYAKGAGANFIASYADESDPVRGRYLDNTEIGKALHTLLGVH